MPLRDITEQRIDAYAQALPGRWANVDISALRTLLGFGVKRGYLRKNPADGVRRRLKTKERVEIAQDGVSLDSNEEVQIALEVAAKFVGGALAKEGKPGGLVWLVIFRYYGNLRVKAECPHLDPAEIRENAFRVFSSKTLTKRGKDLPTNAILMLDYFWPEPRSTDTTGWRQLWELIKEAQNRYLREAGKNVPTKRYNRPRHTGCAHGRFLKKERRQFLIEDDHDERNFEGFYNALSIRREAARFFAQYPLSMPLTKESEDKIRAYLVLHGLIQPEDSLPEPLDVRKYLPKIVEKMLWRPTIPLTELRDLIFALGMAKAAKLLGTHEAWLRSMSRALRVPVPPPGRSEVRKHPETAETPPPLTTLLDEEIEQLIKREHGVLGASKILKLDERDLRAWCVIRGIRVPNACELGRYYNSRERVRAHQLEVGRLLKKGSLEEIAKHLDVSAQCLEAYCNKRGISFSRNPPPPPPPPPTAIEQIRRELALHARRPRDGEEAVAWVLSRAAAELRDSEVALAVEEAFGLKFTGAEVRQIADQNPVRFECRNGIVRLIGHYLCELDMVAVKIQLESISHPTSPFSLPEAIRRALELTFGGLTVEQLSELLPVLGIELDKLQLQRELKRLDRQNRIRFSKGRVTTSDAVFDFKRPVRDREATPGFEQICDKVKETYEGIVEQRLSNLDKLRLILHCAPDGLWQSEIARAAKYAGIDLRESAIECVPGHEGKGELRRNHGRVEMITDEYSLVQKSELTSALCGTTEPERIEFVVHLLASFPRGLSISELVWACNKRGEFVSVASFAHWLYLCHDPRVKVSGARAYLMQTLAAEAA
ncbi:MAG: hypothetical protein U1G07_17705 [Verrucomicrobiota bacterium]